MRIPNGKLIKLSLSSALAIGLVAVATMPASAQTFAQRHPRRAEVLHRDQNLNRAINRDAGHLSGQYANLKTQDRTIVRQEQADARANGGFITKGQQVQLNQEESALRQEVRMDNNKPGSFASRHPGRAEVLGRDANLDRAIIQDKGHLSGQFGNLMNEDRSIKRQEQVDAAVNGGVITGREYRHLNREESHLRNQIQRDSQ
ncbi:MAG TPA: hypothetical protein V6D22_13445 [Candidatus Obscuribacterales bacterium]